MFEEFSTTAEIEMYVSRAYNVRQRVSEMQPGDRISLALPLPVSKAGPLLERAVAVADGDGLTLQEERWERSLKAARISGNITEAAETRPNKNGRPQRQIVFRRSMRP